MLILNLKKAYPFKCLCGHEEKAVAPSMFMSHFQTNVGGVHCPGCKKHISVRLDDENERLGPVAVVPEGIKGGPLPDACYREATRSEIARVNLSKKTS